MFDMWYTKKNSMIFIKLYLALLLSFLSTVSGARILAVEPIAGKSHWNFMKAVLQALTDVGHQVTVFTPFLDGERHNYTEIDISQDIPVKTNLGLIDTLENFQHPINLVPKLVDISRLYCDLIYNHKQMKQIINTGSNSGFDIALIEPLWTECLAPIATKLKIPLIYIVPSPTISHMERTFTGHMLNPSYVGHLFSHYSSPARSFLHRFSNFILFVYVSIQTQLNEVKSVNFNIKDYDKVNISKPSIIFQNTHFVTEISRPFVPSVIQIGGIHLKEHQSIPKDILEFIENSPHGVIFITFGSVVKMSTSPKYIENAFKETLAKLPQRVLWKYEGEMENMPTNVMIKKWFPQRDILLHPNIKLFISHGGISGVYEAVDAGVPVLGFPLFYDQPRNIDNLVKNGMALSLDLLTLTQKQLHWAITEMINNTKYTVNAKFISKTFKDRPMSPEKLVVYWTEYVIRHKGATHLKSHALDLKWYQYFLMDIIGCIILILLSSFFILYKTLNIVVKLIFKNYVKQKTDYTILNRSIISFLFAIVSFVKMKFSFKYFIISMIFTIILMIKSTQGARILAVETIASKSCWNFFSAVLKALVEHGHEVTVFTPLLDGNRTNYTEVDMSNDTPILTNMDTMNAIAEWQSPQNIVPSLSEMSKINCDILFGHKIFQDILKKKINFNYDILFIEPLSLDCQSIIASELDVPMVHVIGSPTYTFMERTFTGQILNPAYVSHMFSQNANPNKLFLNRFSNLILYIYTAIRLQYDEFCIKYTSLKWYYGMKHIKPSIIFQNTHYITEPSRPIMPSTIQIGGIHLKSPTKIPNDILDFIESSPYGVIYFTFGSVVTMSTLPKDILNSFKDALAKVPQRILWKFEGEMDDKPANVMIKKWFPQRDILLHPKVKLFISHGGISGVYEAVDAGVPVLGFPLLYDQPRNIDNLVENGMALSLDLLTFTQEQLYLAIIELVNRTKYTNNAKIVSARFKDRPMTPVDSVVYWTEYVIRHKGAPHLKSQAIDLKWYQYFLIDIFAVIILAILIASYMLYNILKYINKFIFKCMKQTKVKSE
ncbi:uncharacterized protein LOC126904011 [Daktulosphaira vitifoliae]|uniref:uncharacterized protein LOC126904011 n=1 Tax=Daktulosphaira vitifoliae TaxID=58002 RepID=UPI0021AA95C4|nr:uncharacterized protein LOC126904011 [Daktulosphaira vitifoliae]